MFELQNEQKLVPEIKSVELDNWKPLEKEVSEMVHNYSKLVVNEQTLPDIRLAADTVSKKRIDIGKIRADGTSKFENIKKQFQTNADRLIAQLMPVENKLKSDINQFDDDNLWTKAMKDDDIKGYTSYLKKFDNPNFEYKGKNVLQARAKLEAFENAIKMQNQNYQKFVDAGFRINSATYPTKENAIEAKDKLTTLAITPEIYGEKVAEILEKRSQFLELFSNLIIELEAKEKQVAETNRIAKIKNAIDEIRKYQSKIIAETKITELNAIKTIIEATTLHESFYQEFYTEAQAEYETTKKLVNDCIAKVQEADRVAAQIEENTRIAKELEERQLKMERAEADRLEAEKLRLEQIEAKEKELAELKEKQEKEEAEKKRVEELKAQGKIEIGGKIYDIEVIEKVNAFFKVKERNLPLHEDSQTWDELIIHTMNDIASGKKTYDDLSDLQRANLALRNEMNVAITTFTELFYTDFAHAFKSNITTPSEMATTFKDELTKCLTNKI